ncbi:unnamed protein product [Rodentolepis nana]|uniref:Uncharacterized protein n=1 Tax=Rodentolepis nana TaxID=102285 RepID=A0A0R3THE9_RODNA|nr:unnamed protein product [Rodentolepis nana]
MMRDKFLIFCIVVCGFAVVGYSLQREKCDCYAAVIPENCYKLCNSITQPPPPARYDILKKLNPVPGYSSHKEKVNPRPPAPPVTAPPLPQPQRIRPCPNGNCPVRQEPSKQPPGWGGDCTSGDCLEGQQPKPPQNSRQRRKLGDHYKLTSQGRNPGGTDLAKNFVSGYENITVPGWGSKCPNGKCVEGKQPPPYYSPHCNWKQQGGNSSSNTPQILKFASGGVNKIRPSDDLISQPQRYQACLKDGSCGCWGGDVNYLSMKNDKATCEPYGCGYKFGSSCGIKWTILYADYERYPGHMRIDFVTKSEILRIMPHIDLNFANVLFFVEPGFARYIINKHMDLPNLLFYMDEPVLYKMMDTVPNLESRISGFTPVEISNVFCRVHNQCHFMDRFSKKSQDIIIFKVKYLKHCREKKVVKPYVNMITNTPGENLIITKTQIALIEEKIPKFRALIPRITETGARLVSNHYKDVSTLFVGLHESIIARINNFLDTFADKLYDFSNEEIAEKMIGSTKDVMALLVKRLFI